jgi:hypothetical protein
VEADGVDGEKENVDIKGGSQAAAEHSATSACQNRCGARVSRGDFVSLEYRNAPHMISLGEFRQELRLRFDVELKERRAS